MAEIESASRSIYQAHLAPVKIASASDSPVVADLEKYTHLRRLGIDTEQLEATLKAMDDAVDPGQIEVLRALLGELAVEPTGPTALRLVPTVAELRAETVTAVTDSYLEVLRDEAQRQSKPHVVNPGH